MSETFGFVDFGAGTGASFGFAATCASGRGLAVDIAQNAVEECKEKGYDAEVGDVTSFDRKNIATATFAVNLLQEMPGRPAFRDALINIVRAGTDFSVIQHPYFDADARLALSGFRIAENFTKAIVYKPTVADYVDFFSTYRETLSLVGMAIFNSGSLLPTPIDSFDNVEESEKAVPKTMRIVFGRKKIVRFRQALKKAKTGTLVLNREEHDVAS